MLPHRVHIHGAKELADFIVIYRSCRIAPHTFEYVYQSDIAFRYHKRRKNPLGVLISSLFGRFTEDCDDSDFFVFTILIRAYQTGKISMEFYFMNLPAKRAGATRKKSDKNNAKVLPIIRFRIKI